MERGDDVIEIIVKGKFLKEVKFEDVYIFKWKILNSVLLKKGYMV